MAKRRTERTRTTLADQLRAAVLSTGLSEYRIAEESGVNAGALSLFMRGERDFTLGTADRLAAYLGLELAGSRFVANARPPASRLPRRGARTSAAAIAGSEAPEDPGLPPVG